ncbi:MAG: hypothetical protein H6712_11550 [Myxococcales bacterium]|nr:hypothetical protein [Myxococcales bacterium]MCB9714488.1 hypothetical protein [Myxococcales bacterium]
MSVAQLAELAGMDVDSMVALVLGKRGAAPAAAKAPARRGRRAAAEAAPAEATPAQAAPATGKKAHNTRTREGREALDQAIIAFLKEQAEPVRALDIRKGVGGTAAQIRTRLNVLIEQGKVTYKGRASGTRYKAK